LLGRFAGPGPLLVLCCIRLILNDFSTMSLLAVFLATTTARSVLLE
jgi:hypothetical protein